ncbi:MAG: TetR/AcrR family transcriptional regulator [Sulfurovaceae bacterium]|nr:TetR/AcrR family transcriptional regulator [Sulfurovaceae bacterium]
MAIVVDKKEKRRLIALSCKGLLLEHGIKNLTVSQIAKVAGVGKGTIYEYFANKDEIVFEIITLFIDQFQEDLAKVVANDTLTSREKLEYFMLLVFSRNYNKELIIYQEFLSIALSGGSSGIVEFRNNCRDGFEGVLYKIIEQGIKNKELQQNAKLLIPMIRYFHTGLIVDVALGQAEAKEEIDKFINSIFNDIVLQEE